MKKDLTKYEILSFKSNYNGELKLITLNFLLVLLAVLYLRFTEHLPLILTNYLTFCS